GVLENLTRTRRETSSLGFGELNYFGALAGGCEPFVDFSVDFLLLQQFADLVSYLFQRRRHLSGFANLGHEALVVVALDLLLRCEHERAESEINKPLDQDPLAQQLVDLLRRKPYRTRSLAKLRFRLEARDKRGPLLLNLVLGDVRGGNSRGFLRDQSLIDHHVELLPQQIRADRTDRAGRLRVYRNAPKQIDSGDDVVVDLCAYLIDDLLSASVQ